MFCFCYEKERYGIIKPRGWGFFNESYFIIKQIHLQKYMKKKILIVYRSQKEADLEILDTLKEIFKLGGIEFSCITDFKSDIDCRLKSTADFIECNFIAIVYYNCSNFNSKIRLPIIWIIDINSEKDLYRGLSKANQFDLGFLLPNGNKRLEEILTNNFSLKKLPLFPIKIYEKELSKSRSNNKCKNILVDLNINALNQTTIINMIIVLNEIPNVRITFLDKKWPIFYLNGETSLINKNELDLTLFDLIISHKNTAIIATLSQIPCIVVGEYGYGGLINSINIKNLFSISFNGRVGGYFNEQIPIKLFRTDIHTILFDNNYQSSANDTHNILKDLLNTTSKDFLNDINVFLKHNRISIYKLSNTKFKKNSHFEMLRISDEKWVIVDKCNKVFFEIENNEKAIIDNFNEAISLKNLSEIFPEIGLEGLKNFILKIYTNRLISKSE